MPVVMPAGAKFDAVRDALANHSSTAAPPEPKPPTSPPPFVKNKYNWDAQNRKIPPRSVMIALTRTDLQRYLKPQNPLRTPGTEQAAVEAIFARSNLLPLLNSSLPKRRNEEADTRPAKRIKSEVAEFYNARPNFSVDQRGNSPIIGLKAFNNWIKSVIIAKFAAPALRGGVGGRVLDLGCGKGGDLQKWQKAHATTYIGLDIAEVSIQQARERWQNMRSTRLAVHFDACDCFQDSITTRIRDELLQPQFDVVSMQFCMHYAFETEQRVRVMLRNVTLALRKGGIFIGTIPNDAQLMERLADLPDGTEPLAWGNSVYKIRFDARAPEPPPVYGHRYNFFLEDAVGDVPEYVVHWEPFERLASQYNLRLLYRREFHQVFEEERAHADYGPLLQRMKVVDAAGESSMDEEQWEAANVYVAFAFEMSK